MEVAGEVVVLAVLELVVVLDLDLRNLDLPEQAHTASSATSLVAPQTARRAESHAADRRSPTSSLTRLHHSKPHKISEKASVYM